MKSAAWRMQHIADADEALETAGRTLASRYFTDDDFRRANALILLARAHYRAVEVDALTKDS
jgi:hypothetical protein